MWKLTREGRNYLEKLVLHCGTRTAFAHMVGLGKGMPKLLLDNSEYVFNARTLSRLQLACRALVRPLTEDEHYQKAEWLESPDTIRLIHDRAMSGGQALTASDQPTIERLYRAFYENPAFTSLRAALDPPSEFNELFSAWDGISEDRPSELYMVYRRFRNKAISFLCGDRFIQTHDTLSVFALWYLAGVSNATYEGSPVGLTEEEKHQLAVEERTTTVELIVPLLEELRKDRQVSHFIFELEAVELREPRSYIRRLLRVYSRAEDDLRRRFSNDALLRDARCYVLDFPYLVPRHGEDPNRSELMEHRLVCCPMMRRFRAPYLNGQVPAAEVRKILVTIYRMYLAVYDPQSRDWAKTNEACERALELFDREWTRFGRPVPCCTLSEFVRGGCGATEQWDYAPLARAA